MVNNTAHGGVNRSHVVREHLTRARPFAVNEDKIALARPNAVSFDSDECSACGFSAFIRLLNDQELAPAQRWILLR
jgi:hypothetical protein